MPKVALFNQNGENVGEIELQDAVFGIEPNNKVLFDAIVMQRASQRQGTSKVKSRGEVRGGGRKPWRQKGTGRARQGSIRSPQWSGGGIAHGPSREQHVVRSFSNLDRVHVLTVDQLNTYDVLVSDVVVFQQGALEHIGKGTRDGLEAKVKQPSRKLTRAGR